MPIRRLASVLLTAIACATTAQAATDLAPGVHLVSGVFVPGTQPDGNSVIFDAPDGLIVMDTGRHAEHTQKLIDFARDAGKPVTAIINSHWHLDHIGGNPRMRREYPDVRVYASAAVKGAMTGFLANYRKYLEDAIKQTAADSKARTPLQDELAIIDAGPALFPDVVVAQSGERTIAGRTLVLNLETNCVTGGDVWVFDPATRVLAAGDLVTLPVPFLDTACPKHWKTALEHLARADFKLLVPGHGAPMQRRQFDTYRRAFDNLLACAASAKVKARCIEGWVHDAGNLLSEKDRAAAPALLDYYIDQSLRGDAKQAATLCGD